MVKRLGLRSDGGNVSNTPPKSNVDALGNQAVLFELIETGQYEGTARNTTETDSPMIGSVVFEVTKFDQSTGDIEVSMVFSDGLCGGGFFAGTADEKGFSLSGELTSNDEVCGEQSWNMIARCQLPRGRTIRCSYRLSQENGDSTDQKGSLKVARVLN